MNLEKIVTDILREMYDRADPGLDFDDLEENPEKYPDDWYDHHHLSQEEQKEIIKKHCERHNVSKREETTVIMETMLNHGPVTRREYLTNNE